jgi:hypothetical protein
MDCHDRFPLLPEAIFPPPWSVEETNACFIVRDTNGQALAYVYFKEEPGRRAAAHLCGSPMMRHGASPRTRQAAAGAAAEATGARKQEIGAA